MSHIITLDLNNTTQSMDNFTEGGLNGTHHEDAAPHSQEDHLFYASFDQHLNTKLAQGMQKVTEIIIGKVN